MKDFKACGPKMPWPWVLQEFKAEAGAQDAMWPADNSRAVRRPRSLRESRKAPPDDQKAMVMPLAEQDEVGIYVLQI